MSLQSLATRDDSFHAHRDSGKLGDQQQRVMREFHRIGAPPDYSSKEMAEALHIERSSCCARLNELERLGYLEWGTPRLCRYTGKRITPLRLPTIQRELFA